MISHEPSKQQLLYSVLSSSNLSSFSSPLPWTPWLRPSPICRHHPLPPITPPHARLRGLAYTRILETTLQVKAMGISKVYTPPLRTGSHRCAQCSREPATSATPPESKGLVTRHSGSRLSTAARPAPAFKQYKGRPGAPKTPALPQLLNKRGPKTEGITFYPFPLSQLPV